MDRTIGTCSCDDSCNARARASERARALARAQVPADEIEAAIACELGLSDEDAHDVVSEEAPALHRECRRGRADLRAYLWDVAHGRCDARQVTSATLAAAALLGKQYLGLDGVSPDTKVRKLLEQAEGDAARALANRERRGRQHLTTIAGGRAA